jgi:hypothetical protein
MKSSYLKRIYGNRWRFNIHSIYRSSSSSPSIICIRSAVRVSTTRSTANTIVTTRTTRVIRTLNYAIRPIISDRIVCMTVSTISIIKQIILEFRNGNIIRTSSSVRFITNM